MANANDKKGRATSSNTDLNGKPATKKTAGRIRKDPYRKESQGTVRLTVNSNSWGPTTTKQKKSKKKGKRKMTGRDVGNEGTSSSEREESEGSDDEGSEEYNREEYNQLENENHTLKERVHSQITTITKLQRKCGILQQQMESLKKMRRNPEIDGKVRSFAKKVLFRGTKFITTGAAEWSDINTEGSIGRIVLNQFEVPKEEEVGWWNLYKVPAAAGITEQRNNVGQAVRKVFKDGKYGQSSTTSHCIDKGLTRDSLCRYISLFTVMNAKPFKEDEGEEGVPPWKRKDGYVPFGGDVKNLTSQRMFMNVDGDEVVNEFFLFFAYELVGCIVGRRNWKQRRCAYPVSTAITVSDEAFLLLQVENQWSDLTSQGTRSTRHPHINKGRYTKMGTNRANDGWTSEGIERFNELVHLVQMNRKCRENEDVEEATRAVFLKWDGEDEVGTRRKKRRRTVGTEDQESSSNEMVTIAFKEDVDANILMAGNMVGV